MKLSDITDQDNASFLVNCQSLFETRATLRYIFSEDGDSIGNISQFINDRTAPQEVYVSSYPYFIGQKEPLVIPHGTLGAQQVAQILNVSSSKFPDFKSPNSKPREDPNTSNLMKLLKQRHHTPSLIAKRQELKLNYESRMTQLATSLKSSLKFQSSNHSTANVSHFNTGSSVVSPFTRKSVLKATTSFLQETQMKSPQRHIDEVLKRERLNRSEIRHTKASTFFPALGQTMDSEGVRRFSNPQNQSNQCSFPAMTGDNYGNLNELSFKDYVHSFQREQDFTEKPYAKFYANAIKKHREQIYTQMSQVRDQKSKFIDNLRISEDDMLLPDGSKAKLGQILSNINPDQGNEIESDFIKDKRSPLKIQQKTNIVNVGRNENGLILATIDDYTSKTREFA